MERGNLFSFILKESKHPILPYGNTLLGKSDEKHG